MMHFGSEGSGKSGAVVLAYNVHRTYEKMLINPDGRGKAMACVYEVRSCGVVIGHLHKEWVPGFVHARGFVGGSMKGYAVWRVHWIDDEAGHPDFGDMDTLADAKRVIEGGGDA